MAEASSITKAGEGQPPHAAADSSPGLFARVWAAFDAVLRWIEDALIALLLGVAAVVIVVDIVARFVFSSSLGWGPEFVRYSIIWMVFIGGSVAARRGVHISIDALQSALPANAARWLTAAILAISSVFCAYLAYEAVGFVQQSARFGQLTSSMRIPLWWVIMAIPIGCSLMCLRFAERAVTVARMARGHRPGFSTDLAG